MFLEDVFPVITVGLVHRQAAERYLSVKKTELTFSVPKALATVNQSLSSVLEGRRFLHRVLQSSSICWMAFSPQGCQRAMHSAVTQDFCSCSSWKWIDALQPFLRIKFPFDDLTATITTGLGSREVNLAPHIRLLLTYKAALIAFLKVVALNTVDRKDNTYLLFLQIEPVRIWMFAGS